MEFFVDDTFNVYGYCRSTVGGYYIWETNEPKNCIPYKCSEIDIPSTSINVMNYTAMIKCLHYIDSLDVYNSFPISFEFRPKLMIRCGCFIVCQQLNGKMKGMALKEWRDVAMCILAKLTQRLNITIQYDPDMVPSM